MATFRIFEGTEDSAEEGCTYFVGETKDIKALYKSISRHNTWRRCVTNICPLFVEMPRFDERKRVYAVCIDEDNMMTVSNSDTVLSMILDGEIVEVNR